MKQYTAGSMLVKLRASRFAGRETNPWPRHGTDEDEGVGGVVETSHWGPLPPEVTGPARELAEQLRSLLDGAGWSLRRLAADDEVPYGLTTLHRYFAGRTLPPPQLLDVIAGRCGGDAEELRRLRDRARQVRIGARADDARTARPAETATRERRAKSARKSWLFLRDRPMLAAAAPVALGVVALVLATTLTGGPRDDGGLPVAPGLGVQQPSPSPTLRPSPEPTPEPAPKSTPRATPKSTPKQAAEQPPAPEPGDVPDAAPKPPPRRDALDRKPRPSQRPTADARVQDPAVEPQGDTESCEERAARLERELNEQYDVPITVSCSGSRPVPVPGSA